MKKLWIIFLVFVLIFIQGCTVSNDEREVVNSENLDRIEELKQTNVELVSQIEGLEAIISDRDTLIQSINEEKDSLAELIIDYEAEEDRQLLLSSNYPMLANLALKFVRAHTSGDIDTLMELVSDDIEIYKVDEDVYCKYFAYGQEIDFPMYIHDRAQYYKDMVIQGYGYIEEEDIYLIHIAEFMNEDSPYVGGTFLNLSYKYIEGSWKVVLIEFDI